MSYLNQENVFSVASTIYGEVKKRYGLNVEGYYLDDIQNVMSKLWEKNKDKPLKGNQTFKNLQNALNKKSVELILPQVINNIEAGYLNKTQNSLFLNQDDTRQYAQAQQQFQMPQNTMNRQEQRVRNVESGQDSRFEEDPQDAFERLRREREQEGNLAPVLQDQRNVYSNNSYQNRQPTYDNQLPMTPQVRNEVEPDAGAERFVNGQPVYGNDRQTRVKDVGPTNAPGFFNRNNPLGSIEDKFSEPTGPSLDTFFTNAQDLRGIQNPNQAPVLPGTNQNTTREAENMDVEDKFAKLKTEYLQDGKLNRPKDTSNNIEDVIGKRVKNNKQFTEHLENRGENKEVKEAEKKMRELAMDKTTKETFVIKYPENEYQEASTKIRDDDLMLSNQLSNNAILNYPLIRPQPQNYQTRKYYITVDSLQRDLEAYPDPAFFQVRFEQPGNTIEIPSYVNERGVVIYKKPIIVENVGANGATIESMYQNVVELKCTDAQIPLEKPYIGGLTPYVFNGPQVDENKAPPYPPNQFTSYPYGPVYQFNYGIYQDVYDEPYYFLIVEEIDGAYDGTTDASRRAVAKLTFDKLVGITRQFVGLKTAAYEGKVFYPTTLAKLSQMTLSMKTRFDTLLNVGVDKVYIQSIERGDEVTEGRYCFLPVGSHLTKITIVSDDPEYKQLICSTGVRPGDRLIFYSIFNCDILQTYNKLNPDIYINFDKFPLVYFYMVYDSKEGKLEKKLDVRPFLKVGDLIVINGKFYLEILQIDTNGIYLKLSARTDFDPKVLVTQKGFIIRQKRGYTNPDPLCITSKSGQRVGGKLDEPLTFQLLYPFEQLPEFLKSAPFGWYRPKEAFYIHGLKQISYTFEITQVEQNMDSLESRIVSSV